MLSQCRTTGIPERRAESSFSALAVLDVHTLRGAGELFMGGREKGERDKYGLILGLGLKISCASTGSFLPDLPCGGSAVSSRATADSVRANLALDGVLRVELAR